MSFGSERAASRVRWRLDSASLCTVSDPPISRAARALLMQAEARDFLPGGKAVLKKCAPGDFGGMPIPLSMTEILTHPPRLMFASAR